MMTELFKPQPWWLYKKKKTGWDKHSCLSFFCHQWTGILACPTKKCASCAAPAYDRDGLYAALVFLGEVRSGLFQWPAT